MWQRRGFPGRSLVIDGIMKRREQVASGAELIHYFTEDGSGNLQKTAGSPIIRSEYVRALTREERVGSWMGCWQIWNGRAVIWGS